MNEGTPNRYRRRRARVLAATVEQVSRQVVWDRDGGTCRHCGEPVDPGKWHLDHLVPLSRGGEHSYANVAVSCPRCNLRKGPRDWSAGPLPEGHTPLRTFRLDDDMYALVKQRAEREGTTVTAVVQECLRRYGQEEE